MRHSSTSIATHSRRRFITGGTALMLVGLNPELTFWALTSAFTADMVPKAKS